MLVDSDGNSATLFGGLGGAIVGGGIAAWRSGGDLKSIGKGPLSGAISGAAAGSVIDTGGVSLGMMGLSGAVGGVTGGVVSRGLDGEGTTLKQAAVDAAVGGTVGGVLGAGGTVVAAALSRSAANEATAGAVGAADAAQAGGRTSGTDAGLRVGNQTFSDVSTGGAPRVNHPTVQRALDNVPAGQRSAFHGACAEVGCLNQAANSGVNPSGGTMRAVKIRKSGNAAHAKPTREPCSSCENVQQQMGVKLMAPAQPLKNSILL